MKKITVRTLLIATALMGGLGFGASGYAAGESSDNEKDGVEYVDMQTVDELIIGLMYDGKYDEIIPYLIQCKDQDIISEETLRDLLWHAAEANNKDMVSYLIEYGVPVNDDDADANDETLLGVVIKKNCVAVMEPLVKAGARIEKHRTRTVIMEIAATGTVEMLHEGMRLGMNVHEKRRGQNALVSAVEENNRVDNVDMVKELLRLGVDHKVCDKKKRNLLMMAAHRGNAFIMELFVQAGLDVTAVDNRGWNALRYALQYDATFDPRNSSNIVTQEQHLAQAAALDATSADALRCAYEDDSTAQEAEATKQLSMVELWVNRQSPVIYYLLISGIDYTCIDLSDENILPVIKHELERDIVTFREAGFQDWCFQDLRDRGVFQSHFGESSSGIETLIARCGALDHLKPEVKKLVIEQIRTARSYRRLQEAQGVNESNSAVSMTDVDEKEANEAAVVPMTDVDEKEEAAVAEMAQGDTHVAQQLERAYQGDGIQCPACGAVQEDEGFFDCTVCGAAI